MGKYRHLGHNSNINRYYLKVQTNLRVAEGPDLETLDTPPACLSFYLSPSSGCVCVHVCVCACVCVCVFM